jgi:hypothetical protein
MGNQVMYPHMQNYTYGYHRVHMGIPVCIRAGIAKIFAYGDPRLHNKIVCILGATYINDPTLKNYVWGKKIQFLWPDPLLSRCIFMYWGLRLKNKSAL